MRFAIGEFVFDAATDMLAGPAGEVALRPQTCGVLRVLIDRAPALVGQEELLDAVWGRQSLSVSSVPQAVSELRRALGDDPRAPTYIETRHRRGYRLLVEAHRLDEAVAPAAPAAAAESSPQPPPERRRVATAAIALGVVIALAVGLALLPIPGLQSDADQAADDLHQPLLLAGEPREPEARGWYREGLQALALGDFGVAERGLRRASEREPDSVAALAALARLQADAGRLGEARATLANAEPHAAALPRAERLRRDALLAELEDRHDHAREVLQSLFAFAPGDRDAGRRLFALQLDAGDRGGAERTLQRLRALSPHPQRDAWLQLAAARLAGAGGDRGGELALIEAVLASADGATRLEAQLLAARAEFALGSFDQAHARGRALQDAAQAAGRPLIAIRAGLVAANIERERGEPDAAEASYQALGELAAAQSHWSLRGEIERERAVNERMRGRLDAALLRLDAVIEADRARDDRRSLAASLAARGALLQQAGRLEDARAELAAAIDAFARLGEQQGEAGARNNLGMTLAALGRHAEAEAQFERARNRFARAGDRRGEAMALGNLAAMASRAGRSAQAREWNEAALGHYRELGMAAEVARLQFNLALLDRRAGAVAAAGDRLREAIDAFEAAGAEDFRRHAVATLAELRLRQADLAGAEALLSPERGANGGDPLRRAVLLGADARLQALRGRIESAASLLGESQQLREASGSRSWIAAGRLDRAGLDLLAGRAAASEAEARALVREFDQHGDGRALVQALLLQAEALLADDRRDAVPALLAEAEQRLRSLPERELELQLELLHALLADERAPRLERLREQAGAEGFELLALRAGVALAASGPDSEQVQDELRAALDRRGLLAWAERVASQGRSP